MKEVDMQTSVFRNILELIHIVDIANGIHSHLQYVE